MSQTQRADEALELKRLQDHFIDMLVNVFLFIISNPDPGSLTNSAIR